MQISKINYRIIIISLAFIITASCKTDQQWEGQGEIQKVNTQTVPVQRQFRDVFDLGKGIYVSNKFDGARLNGIVMVNDTIITLISPENTPINTSPWYAFKLWADNEQEITLALTYPEDVNHRYHPTKSSDGVIYKQMDSSDFFINKKMVEGKLKSSSATMRLTLGPDTLWISAQELLTTSNDNLWTDELSKKSFITKTKAGESREGRPLNVLKIGESDDKAMIIVLSRQHPPEVTGYLAMQAFVETLSSDSEDAIAFRKKYNTYVFPLVNPDGVDNGNWRHNMGGIDLNRDWEDFNQPETSIIRDFVKNKVKVSDGEIIFFVDFHSTWQDIYYTIDPEQKGNMPGLVPALISETGNELENYNPNVRPSPDTGKRVTSTSYFFYEYGAESLTYEIGDNTPREFVKKKGEITAEKLMRLLLE
jgi:hypothetical protein